MTEMLVLEYFLVIMSGLMKEIFTLTDSTPGLYTFISSFIWPGKLSVNDFFHERKHPSPEH
jgi:hypothetical protein